MTVNSTAFTQAYSSLVVRSWTSEDYLDLLKSAPHAALAEVGLDLPSSATVNVIIMEPTGHGKVEDQVERWEEGERTGVYDLFIPHRPEDLEDLALADESLVGVAGGLEAVEGDNYCCCCTPCCCCT